MYNTILVPVDMSEDGFSDKAIEHAQTLVSSDGVIHLLQIIPGYQMPLVGSFFPDGSFKEIIKQAETNLEKYLKNAIKDQDINYKFQVKEGKPADLILKVASSVKADLIVMASHKHSKLEKTVLGSIASKVVGRSKTPVLVVKPS